eukprot:scaffold27879_cov40-Phaeocystis_antarctica.AAC.2
MAKILPTHTHTPAAARAGVWAWALSVLYRTFGRADGLSRRAQRTASTLIPRAPSEVGVVDPAAIATRAVSSA